MTSSPHQHLATFTHILFGFTLLHSPPTPNVACNKSITLEKKIIHLQKKSVCAWSNLLLVVLTKVFLFMVYCHPWWINSFSHLTKCNIKQFGNSNEEVLVTPSTPQWLTVLMTFCSTSSTEPAQGSILIPGRWTEVDLVCLLQQVTPHPPTFGQIGIKVGSFFWLGVQRAWGEAHQAECWVLWVLFWDDSAQDEGQELIINSEGCGYGGPDVWCGLCP